MKYEIRGEPMPVVICNLEAGETMISEAGSMSWMSPNMQMETSGGGAKKMFGKLLSGESMFRNHYTAQGGPGMIAFASSFPGSVRAIEITPDKPVVLQKRAFLACTEGVEFNVFFQKKLGTALFGGEGFVMQQLSGSGLAFVEIDGSAVEYELAPGQQIVVDTGYVAMMDATVKMDVQQVKGVKNIMFGGEGFIMQKVSGQGKVFIEVDGSAVTYDLAEGQQIIVDTGTLAAMDATCSMDVVSVQGAKNILFGGEGLFNTVITGPGKVVLQTISFTNLINIIAASMPSSN